VDELEKGNVPTRREATGGNCPLEVHGVGGGACGQWQISLRLCREEFGADCRRGVWASSLKKGNAQDGYNGLYRKTRETLFEALIQLGEFKKHKKRLEEEGQYPSALNPDGLDKTVLGFQNANALSPFEGSTHQKSNEWETG